MVAERTCIACRRKADKPSMIRICRAPSGDVFVDGGGHAPGRGAYVCSHECARQAIIGGRLSSALRVGIDRDRAEALLCGLGVEADVSASVRDKE